MEAVAPAGVADDDAPHAPVPAAAAPPAALPLSTVARIARRAAGTTVTEDGRAALAEATAVFIAFLGAMCVVRDRGARAVLAWACVRAAIQTPPPPSTATRARQGAGRVRRAAKQDRAARRRAARAARLWAGRRRRGGAPGPRRGCAPPRPSARVSTCTRAGPARAPTAFAAERSKRAARSARAAVAAAAGASAAAVEAQAASAAGAAPDAAAKRARHEGGAAAPDAPV
jgi:hypothetical protein